MNKKYILTLIFITIFSLNMLCAKNLTNQSGNMLNEYGNHIKR